jgi:hypothetical protein
LRQGIITHRKFPKRDRLNRVSMVAFKPHRNAPLSRAEMIKRRDETTAEELKRLKSSSDFKSWEASKNSKPTASTAVVLLFVIGGLILASFFGNRSSLQARLAPNLAVRFSNHHAATAVLTRHHRQTTAGTGKYSQQYRVHRNITGAHSDMRGRAGRQHPSARPAHIAGAKRQGAHRPAAKQPQRARSRN